jgi:hypothetical protein
MIAGAGVVSVPDARLPRSPPTVQRAGAVASGMTASTPWLCVRSGAGRVDPGHAADRRGQDLQARAAARSAQRAFEAAIAQLREDGTVAAVTVRDDPSHGMLAAVQVSAPAGASPEAIVKRCAELLGGFQIRRAVEFA